MQSFISSLSTLLSSQECSDIHITPDQPIWTRVSGDMQAARDVNTTQEEVMQWLKSIHYGDQNVLQTLAAHGGQDDFAANMGDARIRVHAWLSRGQVNVALRKLATSIPPLASLGLPKEVEAMLGYSTGLILVVGATGSGKSTTLAAAVDLLNATTCGHIVTLEDPIEYIYTDKQCRVRQRQIGPAHDCTTFSAGVIAAMREDPDVIMVGEMRDAATVSAALTAAQTGHLVLATLHTNSAVETIERILSFFPDKERELARSVLSSVLRGVVAQRLVKLRTGSRILAAEILVCTPAIRANINQNQLVAIEQTMETGRSEGQTTMNTALLQLVVDGRISREEALLSSSKREALERRLS